MRPAPERELALDCRPMRLAPERGRACCVQIVSSPGTLLAIAPVQLRATFAGSRAISQSVACITPTGAAAVIAEALEEVAADQETVAAETGIVVVGDMAADVVAVGETLT